MRSIRLCSAVSPSCNRGHQRKDAAPTINVMFSFSEPDENSNPYVVLLVNSVSANVAVSYFSWRRLLLNPPDILHVHWPETMVRGSTVLRTSLKALFGLMYLVLRPALGTRLVWTVHNATPHESEGRLSRWFAQGVACSSSKRIYLNKTDYAVRNDPKGALILHGSFREFYSESADYLEKDERSTRARLLFFGLIRRYKGLPQLLDAYEEASSERTLRLDIVGSSRDHELLDYLSARANELTDVSIREGHVPSDQVAAVFADSDLVVLPYTRMQNSGAALLALDMGRPVLVPETPQTLELQSEFGDHWVRLYSGRLSGRCLIEHSETVMSDGPKLEPDMSLRSWMTAGEAHVAIYKMLRVGSSS